MTYDFHLYFFFVSFRGLRENMFEFIKQYEQKRFQKKNDMVFNEKSHMHEHFRNLEPR